MRSLSEALSVFDVFRSSQERMRRLVFEKVEMGVEHLGVIDYRFRSLELGGQMAEGGICYFFSPIYDQDRPVDISIMVLVNDDWYRDTFDQDFSQMLKYDLLHEQWEIWYRLNSMSISQSFDDLSGKYGDYHYSAIERTLKVAHQNGDLTAYFRWVELQLKHIGQHDPHAIRELDFYQQQAKIISY